MDVFAGATSLARWIPLVRQHDTSALHCGLVFKLSAKLEHTHIADGAGKTPFTITPGTFRSSMAITPNRLTISVVALRSISVTLASTERPLL